MSVRGEREPCPAVIQADLIPCIRPSTAHLGYPDGMHLRHLNTLVLKTHANKHTGKDRRTTSPEFPTRKQGPHLDSPGIPAPQFLTATLPAPILSLRSIASHLLLTPAIRNLYHMPAIRLRLMSLQIDIVLPCYLLSTSSRLDGLVKMALLHPQLPTAIIITSFLNPHGLGLWRRYHIPWHRNRTS